MQIRVETTKIIPDCDNREVKMQLCGLGLAACHVSQNCNEKMQVRPAGQAGYPISLVASLDTVPVKCCVPLHYLERERTEGRKREKFYICLDVTRTHIYIYTCIYNYSFIYLVTKQLVSYSLILSLHKCP